MAGPVGPAGSARAYALVNANTGNSPFIVNAASKNISAVRRSGAAGTGFYCLTLAGGVPDVGVAPVVSPEWSLSTGQDLLAYPIIGPRGGTPSCQAGEIGVSTEDFGNNNRNDEVSFTIMIP